MANHDRHPAPERDPYEIKKTHISYDRDGNMIIEGIKIDQNTGKAINNSTGRQGNITFFDGNNYYNTSGDQGPVQYQQQPQQVYNSAPSPKYKKRIVLGIIQIVLGMTTFVLLIPGIITLVLASSGNTAFKRGDIKKHDSLMTASLLVNILGWILLIVAAYFVLTHL